MENIAKLSTLFSKTQIFFAHLKPLTASSMIITVFAVMTYFRFEMLLFRLFSCWF